MPAFTDRGRARNSAKMMNLMLEIQRAKFPEASEAELFIHALRTRPYERGSGKRGTLTDDDVQQVLVLSLALAEQEVCVPWDYRCVVHALVIHEHDLRFSTPPDLATRARYWLGMSDVIAARPVNPPSLHAAIESLAVF